MLALPAKKTATVKNISEATYMLPDDIITALKHMELVERRKKGGAAVQINKAKVKAWVAEHRVSLKPPVDVDAFLGGVEATEEDEDDS